MSFDGQPALYGVIGHPVKHSLSPRIHEFWYEKHQKHARYLALDLLEASPTEDIRALGRAGFSGLNVTLPHKLSALEAATVISDAAMKIGAANTLRNGQTDQGSPSWFADNTDWSGFLWSLDRWIPDLPEKALLIGAGGAARAAGAAQQREAAVGAGQHVGSALAAGGVGQWQGLPPQQIGFRDGTKQQQQQQRVT